MSCTTLPVAVAGDDLTAPSVAVGRAAAVREAASAFLGDLQHSPACEADLLHSASACFLPHPADGALFTRVLAGLAGVPLAALAPTALRAHLDAADVCLREKYAAARSRVRSLDRADLLAKHSAAADLPCPTAATLEPAALAAALATRRAALDDAAPPTLVQFAIHSPHAGFRITQVVVLASTQTLADLHAAICCVADRHVDAWREAHAPGLPLTGALFYVDGTLYRDAHTPGCADYAAPIAAFFEQQGQQAFVGVARFMEQRGLRYEAPAAVPRLAVRSMHDTPLASLSLAVGHSGYLYTHAGSCEHMVTVQDVRLRHADDPQDAEAYPHTAFLRAPRVRRCSVCLKRPAEQVVYYDDLAPGTPAFFCPECFALLHCDESGAPLPEAATLQAFPYFQE